MRQKWYIRHRSRRANLPTVPDPETNFAEFGPLIVDEADKLPSAAKTVGMSVVSLDGIMDTISPFVTKLTKKATPTPFHLIRDAVDDLRTFLKNFGIDQQKPRGVIEATNLQVNIFVKKVFDLAGVLREGAKMLPKDEAIVRDVMGAYATELVAISHLPELHQKFPNCQKATVFCDDGDYRIALRSTTTRFICSSLWQMQSRHSFRSVYLMSATLRDANDSYDGFKHSVGMGQNTSVSKTEIVPTTFGKIRQIVYLNLEDEYVPSDKDQPKMMNPKHLEAVAEAVYFLSKRDERTLVLCQSHAARDDLVERLLAMGVPESQLVVQTKGQKAKSLVGKYSQTPNAIWIGTNWEGMNLVDPLTGETLVKTVVIARIPVPPADEIKTAIYYAINDAVDEAFRKMIQGICRGIRAQKDEIELWILDPRFPMLETYAHKIRVRRAAGRHERFINFDRVLRPKATFNNKRMHYIFCPVQKALLHGQKMY